MDNLDQMLQGADDQTPASQADQGGQSDVTPLVNQSEEEVEFNKLNGSTQDRIRELIADKNRYKAMAEQPAYIPPAPVTPDNPEVKDAVRKLNEVGIATKEDVDRTVTERLNQIRWEQEMGRLESSYDGRDGKPQFNRVEVEDYIRSHPQYMGYQPEDVFKFKMFGDDFLGTAATPRRTNSLKPSKQVQQEPAMTVEFIADRTDPAKYSDAREWQEEHKAEIDKVLSTMR